MGTKAIEAVKTAGIKVPELVKLLNKAYCDEWLAYYQYWLGAKLAAGVPKAEVIHELEEHAEEELEHAEMLAERIIQLGGTLCSSLSCGTKRQIAAICLLKIQMSVL